MSGLYDVYSAKLGETWALTQQGEGLTRQQAARLAHGLRQADKAARIVVYSGKRFRYALASGSVK